jgi:arylformamidase
MSYIDISVMVGQQVPVWEGDTPPLFTEEKTEYEKGTIQTTTVRMNVHTGTHIDAPRHFYPDGREATTISIEALMGTCLVVEVPKDIDLITKKHLIDAGLIETHQRVLIKSSNSALWAQKGNHFFKDYIALDLSAAEYLNQLGVSLVGIDYLSIAPFANVWDVHQALLSNGVVILEGLDLFAVTAGVYELICLPIKLESTDGLPVRAVLKSKSTG